jgi:hypothetical protein
LLPSRTLRRCTAFGVIRPAAGGAGDHGGDQRETNEAATHSAIVGLASARLDPRSPPARV